MSRRSIPVAHTSTCLSPRRSFRQRCTLFRGTISVRHPSVFFAGRPALTKSEFEIQKSSRFLRNHHTPPAHPEHLTSSPESSRKEQLNANRPLLHIRVHGAFDTRSSAVIARTSQHC